MRSTVQSCQKSVKFRSNVYSLYRMCVSMSIAGLERRRLDPRTERRWSGWLTLRSVIYGGGGYRDTRESWYGDRLKPQPLARAKAAPSIGRVRRTKDSNEEGASCGGRYNCRRRRWQRIRSSDSQKLVPERTGHCRTGG